MHQRRAIPRPRAQPRVRRQSERYVAKPAHLARHQSGRRERPAPVRGVCQKRLPAAFARSALEADLAAERH